MAVSIAAPLAARGVPEWVQRRAAGIQRVGAFRRPLNTGRVKCHRGTLIRVRELSVGIIDMPGAQYERSQQDQHKYRADQPAAMGCFFGQV